MILILGHATFPDRLVKVAFTDDEWAADSATMLSAGSLHTRSPDLIQFSNIASLSTWTVGSFRSFLMAG